MKHIYTFFIIITLSLSSHAQYSLHENLGFYPTAFSLQKGEKKFNNTVGILNSCKQGVTDNFSFNAGIMLLPKSNAAILRLKYTHSLNRWAHVGISPNIYYIHSERETHFNPSLNGILTLGNSRNFLNISYSRRFKGKHLGSSGYGDSVRPENIFIVGGSIKLSDKFTLLTENVYYTEYSDLAPSLSLRWEFKKNQTLQLGTYAFGSAEDTLIPIPMFSYSIHWGLNKKIDPDTK